jgi:hypothetical protein
MILIAERAPIAPCIVFIDADIDNFDIGIGADLTTVLRIAIII